MFLKNIMSVITMIKYLYFIIPINIFLLIIFINIQSEIVTSYANISCLNKAEHALRLYRYLYHVDAKDPEYKNIVSDITTALKFQVSCLRVDSQFDQKFNLSSFPKIVENILIKIEKSDIKVDYIQ